MTTPSGEIPEGAYVGEHLSDLNDWSEENAMDAMRQPVTPSFAGQRDGTWGMIQDLLDTMAGNYSGTQPVFIDGQTEINDRIELLGKSGYCAAYMAQNYRLGRARDRALPFNTQIGPANDAELLQVTRQHPGAGSAIRSEWCIRMDRAGLWDARATFSHTGGVFADGRSEIVVLRPDLTVYSYTTLPFPAEHNRGNGPTENRGMPVNLQKMFVVPEPGYYVQVRMRIDDVLFPVRTSRGGARLSQFSVTQWSDDIDNLDFDDDADGTIDDGD